MVKVALLVALSTLCTVKAVAQPASEVKIKAGQSIELKAGESMKVTCESEKKMDLPPPKVDPGANLPPCTIKPSYFGGAFDVWVGETHWGFFDEENTLKTVQKLKANAICK